MDTQILTILDNISMEVHPSETIAIVGRSGSGKTSLLSMLAGLHQPSTGTIKLFGKNLQTLNEDERAKLRLGRVSFIFQSFELLNELSALENVMLPLQLADDPDAQQKARGWLEKVGLGDRTHHYPKQLSGGEQQRVAIARAFVASPEIVFADEPTGNLDEKTAEAIIDLMFALNREFGTTMVFVTHDPALAKRCQKTLYMRSGKLLTKLEA